SITRDIKRIEYALEEMKYINMGATAVGTGINTHPKYKEHVVKYLNQYTGFEFESAEDMVDATKHVDSFMYVHNSLKNLAVNLSKMSNDLRLMASGPKAGLGEIILPSKQAGSSIMPGKVNPVIAEMINQVAFQVIGNDTTINMATEAGQMELNVFEPIIFENLFESFDLLTKGAISLRRDIFVDLSVNSEHIKNVGKNSLAGVTALLPVLGYDLISKYAKESLEKDIPLESLLIRDKLIDEETLKMFQDPKTMV
ncbi:MAG: aspartate ammonia-lyase, partial [Erysipelothrix sp.]|nr:aspartate ammonia-lyase [Erysipelothrix sp.]